jgi:L-fuculose-phosphate aldolase
MLENACMIQMIADAVDGPKPHFPDADIDKLQQKIGRKDQFEINFDYLVRRAKRRG